jgi:integrase
MSKVTIRRKSISKARQTLFLDHYPPIYNPYTGKLQRTEYLKLYTFDKPANKAERLHNKETLNLVEFIRAGRQIDIQNRRFGFLSDAVRDSKFIAFFRAFIAKKQKSDSDNYAMSLRYFIAFAGENVKLSELNDYLCEDYKNFLLGGPGISRRGSAITRNTAVNYFAKFRSVIKDVFQKGLINEDLYKMVLPIKPKETHRDRLEIEEFQRLASTPSSSDLMKRAALFSGLTGLRFSDVQSLTYSEVKGVPGKYYLQYIQEKTNGAEVLPISDQAVELIGKLGNPDRLVFDNVKVPKENLFPEISGLKGPLGCLNQARYGIAWGALGAAMDCYDTALRYSKERVQFGKPIGGFQLQQKKLAEMVTEITKAQLLVWRLGVLKSENRATAEQISMAKRNSVEIALDIARNARQMLGGMGITGEYSIMRHMMNLESVVTYEGTHDIHLLITGMDVTGINAFK